jgi:hypothetical protein
MTYQHIKPTKKYQRPDLNALEGFYIHGSYHNSLDKLQQDAFKVALTVMLLERIMRLRAVAA